MRAQVVCEEAEEPYRYGAVNKGKERFVSGIVSPAAPHYVYGLINETQVRRGHLTFLEKLLLLYKASFKAAVAALAEPSIGSNVQLHWCQLLNLSKLENAGAGHRGCSRRLLTHRAQAYLTSFRLYTNAAVFFRQNEHLEGAAQCWASPLLLTATPSTMS